MFPLESVLMKPNVINLDKKTSAILLKSPTDIPNFINEIVLSEFPHGIHYASNHSLNVTITNSLNKRQVNVTGGDVLVWNNYIVDVLQFESLSEEQRALLNY